MTSQTVFPLMIEAVQVEKRQIRFPFIGSADEEIEDAVENILDSYSPTSFDLKKVNYRKPEFRCAYVYLYLASHIQMLSRFYSEILNLQNETVHNWFEKSKSNGKLNLCSIGGGPGTDLCGLIFYLKKLDYEVTLDSIILDFYTEWKHTADIVIPLLDPGKKYIRNVKYYDFDFFQSVSAHSQAAIQNADLVTMVKFVSAVAEKAHSKENLQILLNLMKPGSMFFFLDNARSNCRELINEIAQKCHFSLIRQFVHKFFEIPDEEIAEMKSRYKKRYGYYPQMNTHVTVSLWKKKSDETSFICKGI